MINYRIKEQNRPREYRIQKRVLFFFWVNHPTKSCYNLGDGKGVLLDRNIFTFKTEDGCREHYNKYVVNPYRETYKGLLIERRFHTTKYEDRYVIKSKVLSYHTQEQTTFRNSNSLDEIKKRIDNAYLTNKIDS